jgi:hypothetical protein
LLILDAAVSVIVAEGPGQIELLGLIVGTVEPPLPFAIVGEPVNTVIVTVLLVAVVGDAQVAFDVITTEITSPLLGETL